MALCLLWYQPATVSNDNLNLSPSPCPFKVYPGSFRQLWTMVEPCAFMLGRSRDTNSNLHGRAPCGLLTLQCSCHFFSGWFGLLLQMFSGSETNLSLITVTCWLLYGFQSKGGMGSCDIIIMINEQTKYRHTHTHKTSPNQNLRNTSRLWFQVYRSCVGVDCCLLWVHPVIACIPF